MTLKLDVHLLSLILALTLSLVCVGCTTTVEQDTLLETPATTLIAQPTSVSRPEYVLAVSPEEGTVISEQLYQADLTEEYFEQTGVLAMGALRSPEIGYNNSICVYFDLASLVEAGDDFTEMDKIVDRSQLRVNGLMLDNLVDAAYLPDLHTSGGARYGGPNTLCWEAQLETGQHQVTFGFLRTSGKIEQYSWQFMLVER